MPSETFLRAAWRLFRPISVKINIYPNTLFQTAFGLLQGRLKGNTTP